MNKILSGKKSIFTILKAMKFGEPMILAERKFTLKILLLLKDGTNMIQTETKSTLKIPKEMNGGKKFLKKVFIQNIQQDLSYG